MTAEIHFGCHTSHPYNVCPACVEKAITEAVVEMQERCAKVADDEPELEGEPPEKLLIAMQELPILCLREVVIATKRNIAAAIRMD